MRPLVLTLFLCAILSIVTAMAWGLPLERGDPLFSRILKESGEHVRILGPTTEFTVDRRLRRNVEFWIGIFTRYSTEEGVIHDAKHIDRVYEVLDLKTYKDKKASERAIRSAKNKWKQVLLSLHRKQSEPRKLSHENLTEDELHVLRLFQDVSEPNKYLNASHRRRLRFQLGQKDRFLQGLIQSGRYLAHMEEIFRKEGLPLELTRLPFVESSFDLKARSHVGASGIWQFMRGTGRRFLVINDAVDERDDPIRATEAAAKLMRSNFESLGSWPLAVTAYNHGRMGMMRAVRVVGSENLADLVANYRSRTFGFASANFFAELVAAVEVEKDSERHFGPIRRDRPLLFYEVEIPDYVALDDLVRFMSLDLGELRKLNPGLRAAVYEGKRVIPARYRLRLPWDGKGERESAVRVFKTGYAGIPSLYKLKAQRGSSYGRRVTSEKKGR